LEVQVSRLIDAERSVTSKEAQRHWKDVTDKALRSPVVITSHGRPRHVLMAYEDYARLRRQVRQAFNTADMPRAVAQDLLDGLSDLAAPRGAARDGDPVID
jgi:prevent-host-death family protein